jgi:hypothetical protein
MTAPAPRLLLALAIRSLPAHRQAWGQAMAAEFEIAEADGRSFSFALGCLYGAWRTLPGHGEGRFALANHAVVLGLLVPMATIAMVAALFGFPWVEIGDGLLPFLTGDGAHPSLLTPGTYAVAPALTLVTVLLTMGHLFLAWWALDRDWPRVAAAMRFNAASLMTLASVSWCIGLDVTPLFVPLGAWAVEAIMLRLLAGWHSDIVDSEGAVALHDMS